MTLSPPISAGVDALSAGGCHGGIPLRAGQQQRRARLQNEGRDRPGLLAPQLRPDPLLGVYPAERAGGPALLPGSGLPSVPARVRRLGRLGVGAGVRTADPAGSIGRQDSDAMPQDASGLEIKRAQKLHANCATHNDQTVSISDTSTIFTPLSHIFRYTLPNTTQLNASRAHSVLASVLLILSHVRECTLCRSPLRSVQKSDLSRTTSSWYQRTSGGRTGTASRGRRVSAPPSSSRSVPVGTGCTGWRPVRPTVC